MKEQRRILSLDPSSTTVGYAVMDLAANLIQAGAITPEKRSAGSYERIVSLRRQLREILDEVNPAIILLEWTVGKVGQRRHSGGGAGLAVYGCAVGAIATECEQYGEKIPLTEVFPITENLWTRGVTKEYRSRAVAAQYPAYRQADDPCGDVSDAIGLAVWWLREQVTLWS